MGRSCDEHDVEVGRLEQFLVKLESPRALALKLLHLSRALLQVLAIDVTQGRYLHASHFESGFYVHHAVPAATD